MNWPITLLDLILLIVMLISALLAMVRGFMREVLSLASWASAAAVTLFFYKRLQPTVEQYFNNQYVSMAIVVLGLFFGTLIVVAVVTIKISDAILDSRIGALDRTLGFLFGLARGFVIVAVAFAFFDWLVLPKAQPKWITEAKSLIMLQNTRDWLVAASPDLEAVWQKYKARKGVEPDQPETPAGGRSSLGPPAGRFAAVEPKL
jgi:membrane protein required for colicin V production